MSAPPGTLAQLQAPAEPPARFESGHTAPVLALEVGSLPLTLTLTLTPPLTLPSPQPSPDPHPYPYPSPYPGGGLRRDTGLARGQDRAAARRAALQCLRGRDAASFRPGRNMIYVLSGIGALLGVLIIGLGLTADWRPYLALGIWGLLGVIWYFAFARRNLSA